MTEHPLDRPIWNSLATHHLAISTGTELARRYPPEVSPLAAIGDETDQSRQALSKLVAQTGAVIISQIPPFDLPESVTIVWDRIFDQMLFQDGLPDAPADDRIQALGDADAADMLALAQLTEPGPFAPRTHELGQFWGVRQAGDLIAMAGERMHTSGYAEISAVCTHPHYRGQGLARTLCARVARTILERGEQPFLHADGSNPAAMSLYQSLGFRKRANLRAVAMKPADPAS